MKWEKKGLIFVPSEKHTWNQSHAAVPTLDVISDKIWRIYYASRDCDNRSYISYFDVEAGKPENILYEHNEPILPLGKLGTFDDSGLMPSWLVNYNGKKYLYYVGWNIRKTVPYHNAIGVAISEDNGKSYYKYSDGPVFGLTLIEPYFTGTSCVLIENGIWKNWYLSCTEWKLINGIAEPYYHIKYAESKDGIHWIRNGDIAIDYENIEEAGIVRASVVKENDIYKMWYSHREGSNYRTDKVKSYRIGYAESNDGFKWKRMDNNAGIDISKDGWDSQMIEYPYVFRHCGTNYMFYNGNGFGQTGIGYAINRD